MFKKSLDQKKQQLQLYCLQNQRLIQLKDKSTISRFKETRK